MKTLELNQAPDLIRQYLRSIHHEAVVITDSGTPCLAVLPFDTAEDRETLSLSLNPHFWSLIEKIRKDHQEKGGHSLTAVCREFGISEQDLENAQSEVERLLNEP